jgi:hypothetical protein
MPFPLSQLLRTTEDRRLEASVEIKAIGREVRIKAELLGIRLSLVAMSHMKKKEKMELVAHAS